jgi:hypothetical protein
MVHDAMVTDNKRTDRRTFQKTRLAPLDIGPPPKHLFAS